MLKFSMAYKDPEDQRAANRKHYLANQESIKLKAKIRGKLHRAASREFILASKAKPCADCSVQYPYYVMQFDHLENKLFDIGRYNGRSVSISRLAEEIEKCEVVCANCHAERTHRRRQET